MATNRCTIVTAAAVAWLWPIAACAAEKVTFEDHVRPILRQHCAGCHNQDDAASDFAADGYDGVITGGAGGEVLAPGDPDGSRLWRLVNHDEEPKMPPGGDKLPPEQLEVIRFWIAGGLLRDAGSKPMAAKKSAIAAVDPSRLGKPEGEPAVPSGLFHQPVMTAPTAGPVDAIAASPWAPVVAVGWQRQISFYHSETSELLGIEPFLEGPIRTLSFSRDGSLIVAAGGRDAAAGAAAVYDVATGARLATIGDELDTVLAADISADNALVAIGGPKKKVRVYRTSDGSLAYTCGKHTDWITALSFSPDGKLLATGDRSAGLRLWQAAEGHERGDLRGHSRAITSVAWRRDGGLLGSSSEDGSVRLWDQAGNPIKSINAHGGGVRSVAFAADGRLATAGRDNRVKLWKPDGAALGEVAKTPDIALGVAFTHDDRRILWSDWTGGVGLSDVESKQAVASLTASPATLEARVADAEIRLKSLESSAGEAADRLAASDADLDEARGLHAKRREQIEAAERDESAAQAKVAAAAAVRERSAKALDAVRLALGAVEESFATDGDAEPAADSKEVKGEADAIGGVRAALTEAVALSESLSDRADKTLASARSRLEAARVEVERLNDLSDLPSVEAREAERTEREADLKTAREAQDAARSERDRLAAELARFQAAGATLGDAHGATIRSRDDLAQAEAEASAALVASRAGLREMEERLEALRAKIERQRAAVQDSVAADRASKQRVADAERAIRIAEARLEAHRAASEYRENREP